MHRGLPAREVPRVSALENPAALAHVGFQDIGNDAARFHLDIETDEFAQRCGAVD